MKKDNRSKNNKLFLDKKELELLKELENSNLEDVPLSDKEREFYSSYAKYTKHRLLKL